MFLSFVAAATALAAVAQQCNVQTDTAFTGFDIGYFLVNSSDVNSCVAACRSQPLCSAFTLYPGGRCFTKTSGATTASPLPGAVSCIVSPAASSTCPMGLSPCAANSTSPGACAMFADTCAVGVCAPGSVLCPDGTCLPPGAAGWAGCPAGTVPPFFNSSQPLESRVLALLSAMSVQEIAPQLNNQGYGKGPPGPPGIPRLSIPPYNWLNEGLHGVARSGLATSFPQISVTGQSWNRTSWWWVGRVLGLEARVKHTMYRRGNQTTEDYTGITYYAPNINIGRDPRWGRIQEVPTEDPAIMAAYGTAVVLGAQATGAQVAPPAWLVDPVVRGSREGMMAARARKAPAATAAPGVADDSSTSAIIACCKHAVAYSVEEYEGVPRAGFNARVTGADMLDTYLPAFQACFMQGGGRSSMCSYNAVNGVPTCASHFLLNTTIRQRYGRGDDVFIMSDYGAVGDAFSPHDYCPTKDQCTAAVLAAGVDQDGGGTDFAAVPALISEGYLTETQVRTAAARLFRARISLGLLNTPETVPYVSTLDVPSTLDTDFHRQLSLEAAQQGIVLLTNRQGVLPLTGGVLRKVAVVGPNADVPDTLYGNYQGTPPYLITPRAGMVAALGGDASRVYYAPGCLGVACPNTTAFPDAVAAASQADADAVLLVLGIDTSIEAEGMDRQNITLPGQQTALAQAVCAAAQSRGAPCIVVYITGGPISDPWSAAHADAVVLLGYASQSAGTALAQVLLGQVSPSGKLAVTWPMSVQDLPAMGDMGMRPNATGGTQGRTYRFNPLPVLYPFGHGMSYSTWRAGPVTTPSSPVPPCAGVNLTLPITNTGSMPAGLVVQVYVSWPSSVPGAAPPALRTLAEWERVYLGPGESTLLSLTVPPHALALVNATAAASFAQDFAMQDPSKQSHALSGSAFGITVDYHGQALQAGAAPIGWDDLFLLPTGTPLTLWVGSGQPGDVDPTGLPGQSVTLTLGGTAGGGVNLAQCDLEL